MSTQRWAFMTTFKALNLVLQILFKVDKKGGVGEHKMILKVVDSLISLI